MNQFNVDIFKPEWLNVVFAGRNQAYGAYQLRRQNAGNTNRALAMAVGLFLLVMATPTVINWIRGYIPKAGLTGIVVTNPDIHFPPPPDVVIPKAVQPAEAKQAIAKSKTDIIKDFPPVVTRDAKGEPPTDAQLATADPGPVTMKGRDDGGILIEERPGDVDVAGKITEAKGTDENEIRVVVELMPAFPGGEAAFGKFLQKNIRYPDMAKEAGIQGIAYIQFVVERDGSLTDIKIVRNPGAGTGEEAQRVLKISPHWKPGIQNGRPVRVQYTVPVNFSLNPPTP